MASLLKLVTFRMLLDELDAKEFSRFITDLMTKCGRDIVTSALFNQFADRKETITNYETLDTIISIIKDIMRSRKLNVDTEQTRKLHNASAEVAANGMLSLSNALIGRVASYLEFDDHISLGRCSRVTFIGCNSPCTLRRLDLLSVDDYASVDLCKYPKIRFLALDLHLFDDLSLPDNGAVCKDLKMLQLDNQNESDADIEEFLNSTAFSFANITRIRFSSFGNTTFNGQQVDEYFPTNQMISLLSKFPNIEHLHFKDVFIQITDDALPRIGRLLSKLKVLKVDTPYDDFVPRLLSQCGNHLKALEMPSQTLQGSDLVLPSHIRLESLEEILSDGSTSLIEVIRDSTTSLKRIYLDWIRSDESMVIDVISQQKDPEQVVIFTGYEDLKCTCTLIERWMFNTRKIKKDQLQIKFRLYTAHSAKTSDVLFNIARVMTAFQSTEIENFQLRLRFDEDNIISKMEGWGREIECFQKQNRSKFTIEYNYKAIIVTNAGNSFHDCIFNRVWDGWLTEYYQIW